MKRAQIIQRQFTRSDAFLQRALQYLSRLFMGSRNASAFAHQIIRQFGRVQQPLVPPFACAHVFSEMF